MLMVVVFLLALCGFLAWLGYVAYRDPAGIFRPRPRPSDEGAEAGGQPDSRDDPRR